MVKLLPFTKMLWRSRRAFLGVLMAMMITPIVFFTMERAKVMIEDLRNTNRLVQKRLKENVKQGKRTGCVMPQLDPFFEEVANISKKPIKTCKGPADWVYCYNFECTVAKEILETVRDIICIYRDIIYVDDSNFYLGEPTKVTGDEKYTSNKSDHMRIHCAGKDMNSPSVRTQWSGYKAALRQVPTKPVPPGREDSFNVMILCLESTSRNGFIRTMQNSYKYLTEKLNAVILNSYNIVGEGTTGALYPILTGKPEEEHTFLRKNETSIKYISSKKFIFNLLKRYGYRTAYFENKPLEISQYNFNWYRGQPADHYLRTFLLSDISRGGKLQQGFQASHCVGATPKYQLLLNLAEEFLQLDGKKFCFALTVDMAYENFTLVPTADETLYSFLQTLFERRVLEDTLVLIMGDHGPRYSTIRDTYRGKLEERLPLMAILLPQKLKELRPTALTALRSNVDVLTTPFDIHATILDVLDLKNKTNKHKIYGSNLPRAMSLLEQIPKSRSCGQASVMPHWCVCIKWSKVSTFKAVYDQVANVLSEFIDHISEEQRLKCVGRHLISTEWVIHHTAEDHLARANYFEVNDFDYLYRQAKMLKTPDEYYQAKVILSPGNSVFEGTMIYNKGGDYFMITPRDISRINEYGDESKCISATHPHLIKYCYCMDKLFNTYKNGTSIV